MNSSEFRKRIGGAALTLAMLLGIGMATSTTSHAQIWDRRDNRNDQYDRYGRYDDRVRWDKQRMKDYAFLLGYHNSYTEGQESYERGYRVSYKDMPGYRDGTNGWLAWMGDRDDYRDAYRRGYEQGFKDGQSRRARRYDRQDVERVLGDDLDRVYGDGSYRNDRYGRDRYERDDRYRYERDDRYGRNDIYRIAQQNGYSDGIRQGQEDLARRRGYEANRSSEYRNAMRGYRSEYGDRGTYQRAYREGFLRGYDEGYRRGNTRTSGRFPWPF